MDGTGGFPYCIGINQGQMRDGVALLSAPEAVRFAISLVVLVSWFRVSVLSILDTSTLH